MGKSDVIDLDRFHELVEEPCASAPPLPLARTWNGKKYLVRAISCPIDGNHRQSLRSQPISTPGPLALGEQVKEGSDHSDSFPHPDNTSFQLI